ncbi:GIY-YIG nuclease family protein [Parendozoicomonas haliclonae]|uniref:GIY-YIG nuclease superfamily protein n=1 Tax=Parendozoicomonas haliclonae TaxID=1960125 RepID=A0A1X7AMQ2_9GAMM|nr:GIY-YIG nuclease family protein [Parendozoicomonas haliclonae]SMA47564.1 GIY-YIG nuclease superfamily protein [Parendozoicomonas haliclonae]
MSRWSVYLIRCRDGSLYCGVSTDVARRFTEHSTGGPRSARYVRGKGPLELVYQHVVGGRAEALRAEYRIKKLNKATKEKLVAGTVLFNEVIVLAPSC